MGLARISGVCTSRRKGTYIRRPRSHHGNRNKGQEVCVCNLGCVRQKIGSQP